MAITFDLSGKGPVFNVEGIALQFKRSYKELRSKWSSIHSPIQALNYKDGALDWGSLTPTQKQWIQDSNLLFARDHIISADGLIDINHNAIEWTALDPESQLEVLRQLSEATAHPPTPDEPNKPSSGLIEFLHAYGDGMEKKSVELAPRQS